MYILNIEGKTYKIEFRHITKDGKHAQLPPKTPIRGVTTCVLMSEDLMAIDNAICFNQDTYSRRDGRFRSLGRLLSRCKRLRAVKTKIMDLMLEIDPPPVLWVDTKKPITQEDRDQRVLRGLEKRAERDQKRRKRAGA